MFEYLRLALCVVVLSAMLLSISGCTGSKSSVPSEKPVAIIFDTDIGTDVDDAGAMAVLHKLAHMGQAKILATISSNSSPNSPVAIDIINTWYGQSQIPVGTSRTGPNMEAWYHDDIANFPHSISRPDDVPGAVDLYRKILAGQPDNSVKIVVVGWMTNMAELLESKPDVHSRLNGKALVAAKVKELVTMGGVWPNNPMEKDYNFRMDGPAAYKVITEWPGKIMFTGLGRDVQTGKVLMEKTTNENPVRAFYENFFIANNASQRSSWDLIAVLYAVRGCGDYFSAVTDGYSTVDKAGLTNWITTGKTSNHSYLTYKMPEKELAKILDELMLPGK
jgi:inosine-uridine nucleoside N-ribohydrolase